MDGGVDVDGPLEQLGEEELDSDAFLPESMTFAGLQHIVDNLCADVHKSMSHWPAFNKELKSLEAFLRVEDTALCSPSLPLQTVGRVGRPGRPPN
jgi:hypothetical protein